MTKPITHRVLGLGRSAAAAILLALTCLFGSDVLGQSNSEDTRRLFEVLDANSDDTLDPYEALDVLLQIESQVGAKVTSKDLSRMLQEMDDDQREEVEEFLEDLDKNGDGKVRLDEVDTEMREFARMLDENGDETISVEEAFKAEENMSEEMFLSPEEIEQQVKEIFSTLDENRDGVLEESEAGADFSWSQIREGDTDANQKVTPAEFQAFMAADNKRADFRIDGEVATMEGVINAGTPAEVLKLIFEQPGVRTIVMKNVPGSIDDEANLRAARYVRKFGFTTIIPSNGSVASGGTDFFLAGKKRIVEDGAKLGIHSWGGPGFQGKDVPKNDPQHQLYLKYYDEIGIPADFYWRTLDAAPANDIHWMTEEEIRTFNVRTTPAEISAPDAESRQQDGKDDQQSDGQAPYLLPPELKGEARMIMALLDHNSDGSLQRSELEGDAKRMLRGVDRNDDGEISAKELAQISEGPTEEVHSKLCDIDTFQNPQRIVPVPKGVHRGINRHFQKYTNILAPNGQPIHFLAMDGWSDERILRARKVMEHFLQDVPDRRWGEKTELANAMANNHATMILLNDSGDMDRVLPALEGLDLQLQDLRANESPFEGEDDYLQHQTRDAAYEEVFHLIHGSGIIFSMREYDREIRNLAKQATASDLWNYDEPDMPGNHFEYIICVYDSYLDLWTTHPTLMEGNSVGQRTSGQSFNGEYKADRRAKAKAVDPLGFAMIEKFNSPHIQYTAELPASFEGTFSISENGKHRYSEKAKHLLNVTLRGTNASNLTGNSLNNRLVGNPADNILQGNGGDDSLFGGAGSDTAIFRGSRSQYIIRRSGDLVEVQDSMVNRDGHDVLGGIEKMKFQDVVLDVDSMK